MAAGTTWEAGFSAPAQLCAIKGHDIHCYGSDGTFGFSVSAIYEDNQDNLWFGTANRIWRWKPGSTKHYPLPAPMRSGLPVLIFARHAIIEGDKGALLVAGYRGIWQFMDGSAQDRKSRTLSVSFCPASVPEAKTVAGTATASAMTSLEGLCRLHLFRCPAHGVNDLIVGLGVIQL
jgi:hypothetical protein